MVRKRKTPRLQSKEIGQIAAALAAAQAEMTSVTKNATNNYLGSRFADLSAVRDASLGALNTHGIAVIQTFRPHTGKALDSFKTTKERKGKQYVVPVQILGYLKTQLCHSSGEWMASELPLVCNWGDPHALGGAITYFRRYALAAMVELAQTDDDGESAKARPDPKKVEERKPPARQQSPPPARPAAQTPAAQPAPPPQAQAAAPPPAKPAPSRPMTGPELEEYARNSSIDPYLVGWIQGSFRGGGYPSYLRDWSAEQVTKAWPDIRDHLQRCKLQSQITSAAIETNGVAATNGVH